MQLSRLNKEKIRIIGLIVILLYTGLHCVKSKPWVVTDYTIALESNTPMPESINVIQGHTITWVNEDSLTHTLQSGTQADPSDYFRIGPIKPGESRQMKFDSVGSFPYHSINAHHPYTGIVLVKEDTVVHIERLDEI